MAAAGHVVSLPLMPGHGTHWRDLERTTWLDWYGEVERHYQRLLEQCVQTFVFGYSMGGALALRLAEAHPDDVAGLVLVNPSLGTRRAAVKLLSHLPVLAKVIRTSRAVGRDIKRPGAPPQQSYDRIPNRSAYQLTKLWKIVRTDLALVTAPTLVYRSREDHVVDDLSSELIRAGLRNAKLEELILEDSYHSACLDNDALTIFHGSLDWIAAHTASQLHRSN